MKTTIYVFSGTGTSLAVAKKIAKELEETTVTSMVTYLEQKEVSTNAERIGIIFPCYYGEIPQIVKGFIDKLKIKENQYVFSVITAGGDAGYGIKFLDELIGQKGKSLDYGTSVVIASNYMVGWYYTMINPKEEQFQNVIKTSNIKINKIASDIKSNKKYVEKGKWLRYKLPQMISPNKYIKDTRPWDKEFSTSNKCNGCGICKKVCPVNNIKIVNDAPEFLHNCQRCMACIQYCPQQALQVNGKKMNKPKYYYPEISIKEISEFHESD